MFMCEWGQEMSEVRRPTYRELLDRYNLYRASLRTGQHGGIPLIYRLLIRVCKYSKRQILMHCSTCCAC